ncbi:DUF6387 family protein [Pseudoalteromonas agarivorans]|uniref:Uncharacterized protein n=1 Tax=Pseudoalteromonas agarivorans TaxID=176102 RepID=A0AAD0U0J5_9GAMM|nr:DUF6387 family protein [Pseudoalteromonas agarivorans]AYM87331.1 hypothetical protein D9T18_11915 [Pseudoalteromonas agarivorans]
MSKKYINNINDRDIAWFNLGNYQYIEEQPAHEVVMEFDVRKRIFKDDMSGVATGWSSHLKVAIGADDSELLRIFINKVIAGSPSFLSHLAELNFYDDLAKGHLKSLSSEKAYKSALSLMDEISELGLRSPYKIWPASIAEVIGSYELLESIGVTEGIVGDIKDTRLEFDSRGFDSKEAKIEALREVISKQIELAKKHFDSGKIYFSEVSKNDHVLCNIDLAGFSDAELVAHFQKSLVEWRELLGVPEPERKVSTPSTIQKLKAFRIIPLLDLLIWELENDVKIKKSILAGLLFHDFENGNAELESGKGKIMRFLDKVMAPNFDFKNE